MLNHSSEKSGCNRSMIDAVGSPELARRVYNLYSHFYGLLASPLEKRPKMRGLELAAIRPHDLVLEVAPGPGEMLLEILKRVDRQTTVHGVDLSPKMLANERGSAPPRTVP